MSRTIHSVNWQDHQADLMNIRTEVFMQEQHVSAADEWDELDGTAQHFLVLSATGEALGCARLLREESNGQCFRHIGRVAIRKPFRNLGLGRELMCFIIGFCKKNAPGSKIYLHAQIDRRHFYEALGFVAEGNVFMDAGIPHISMYLA
jgi:hypothetical protein